MAELDINAYFAKRTAENNKQAQVAEAAVQKRDQLNALQGTPQAPKPTWLERSGMGEGSFLGNRVNDAASLVSGATRLMGDITALPVTAVGAAQGVGVDDEDIAAYNRLSQNQGTEDDVARLQRPIRGDGSTALDQLQAQQSTNKKARAVSEFFNTESIVDQTNREGLQNDLKEGFAPAWDQVKQGWNDKDFTDIAGGVADLILNAGSAAIKNPGGVREFVLENAPQLFVGLYGKAGQAAMAASNVGYAANMFQEGMENYAKQNNGQLPPGEVQRKMAMQAAGAAMMEQVGDVASLGLGRVSKALGVGGKAAEEGVEAATKSFKESVQNTVNAYQKGYWGEGVTEGVQTYLEGEVTHKPASAADIYAGAAIGAMTGGVMSGGIQAGSEIVEGIDAAVKEAEAKKVNQGNTPATNPKASTGSTAPIPTAGMSEAQKTSYEAAVASGDVSGVDDVGVAVAALQARSQQDPTKAEESFIKAQEAVIAAEDKSSDLNLLLKNHGSTPAEIADLQTNLDEMKTNPPADATPEEVANNIRILEMLIANNDADEATVKQWEVDKASIDQQLENANKVMSSFGSQIQASNLPKSIEVANAPVDAKDIQAVTKSQEAADSVINLSISSPNAVTAETAAELASNESNGLSQNQRAYLKNFSEARQAEQVMLKQGDVSRRVYGGEGKDFGLKQYRELIGQALDSGDKNEVNRLMNQLAKFEADHKAKAAITAKAWAQGKGTAFWKNKETGKWEIPAKRLNDSTLKASNGGVLNSQKLMEDIGVEAKAVSAVLAEMKAAVVVKRKQGTQGVANVPVKKSAQGSTTKSASGVKAQQPAAKSTKEATPQAEKKVSGAATEMAPKEDVQLRAEAKPTEVKDKTNTAAAHEKPVSASRGTSAVNEEVKEVKQEEAKDEDVQPEVVEDEAPDGKLTFTEEEAKDNDVANGLVQSAGSKTANTLRPLVKVKNFRNAVLNKVVAIKDFLAYEPGDQQQKALSRFFTLARQWESRIQRNLPDIRTDARAEFKYQDPMQYLLKKLEDGTVDIDENVKTAISFSAFSYVADNAGNPARNTDKQINSLLGKEKTDYIKPATRKKLSNIGLIDYSLADSLGQKVIDALGLKANKTIGQEVLPKLKTVLGAHVIKLLEDEGYLVRQPLKALDIYEMRIEHFDDESKAEYRKKHKAPNENAIAIFFNIAREKNDRVVKQVQAIREATKGSKNVVESLFKTQSKRVWPSLEPVKSVQKTASKSTMEVPENLRKVVKANQERPWKVRNEFYQLLKAFEPDQRRALTGQENVDNKNTHRENQDSKFAANEALEREWNDFEEFYEDYLDSNPDTPFYLAYNVWQNQRVGIDSVVNPQASKIHRHLIQSPDWDTEINHETDTAAMAAFWLRVGEGFGFKTERQDNLISVEDIKQLVASETNTAAVQALIALREGGKADLDAVVKAVEGQEALHTLSALQALADYKYALKTGSKTFKTSLIGEVDGVANGTMFNHLLLGAAVDVDSLRPLMEQGGFYTEGSSFTEFNQFRGTAGNKDVYESTGEAVHNNLKEEAKHNPEQINAIWKVLGKLFDEKLQEVSPKGRKFIKNAMNPLAFGSGMKAIGNGMKNTFISKVYEGFEKLSIEGASQDEINAYVKQLNSLISDKNKIPVNQPISHYMGNALSQWAAIDLQKSFHNLVGKPITETLALEFAPFIERRNELNRIANQAYGLYEVVRNGITSAYIAELVKEGKLKTKERKKGNKQGEVYQISDLSNEQQQELDARLEAVRPIFGTYMSNKDGGNKARQAGIFASNSARIQNNSDVYRVEAEFGSKDKGNKQGMSLGAITRQMTEPGVRIGSFLTHSFDSGVSHAAQALMHVLNIHDANAAGIGQLREAALNLNKATWDAMIAYSPMSEAHKSLSTIVQSIVAMHKAGYLPGNAIAAIQQWASNEKFESFSKALEDSHLSAYKANAVRLGLAAEVNHVSQYSYEGAAYQVTPEDKELIQKKLAANDAPRSKQEIEAAEYLDKVVLKIQPKVETVSAEAEVFEQIEDDPEVPAEPMEVHTEEETPIKFSKTQVLNVLVKAGQSTASNSTKEKLRKLYKAISGGMGIREAIQKTQDKNDHGNMIQWIYKQLTPKDSPFGTYGSPRIPSDEDIVRLFNKEGNVPAERVIQGLARKFQQQGEAGKFNYMLLAAVRKLVDPKLNFKYITSTSTLDDTLAGKPATASRGWYQMKNGKDEIYVLSPEFVESGLTPEVLLHELLHAALANTIEAKNKSPEAQKLIDDLEVMRQEAIKYIAANKLKDEFGNDFPAATQDVHEFVSWGLTNRDFQEKVLMKMPYGKNTGKNSLVKAMKAFIEKLVDLVFVGTSVNRKNQLNSAMYSFVRNTSGLFKEVAKTKNQDKSQEVNLSYVSASTKQAYEKRIDELFSEDPVINPNQGVKILDRSDTLDLLGFGNEPAHLAEGKVIAGRNNHPKITSTHWKKIPQWLENPAAVFESDTVDGALVLIAPETIDGATVRMTIVPRKNGGVNVHILTNTYDGSNRTPFSRWFAEGLGLYVDEKVFPVVLDDSGLRLSRSTWQNKPGTRKILTEKNLRGYRRVNPGDTLNLSMASASNLNQLNNYSTVDIHDALSGNDANFDAQLRNVLTDITESLQGPFGSIRDQLMQNTAMTAMDVWTEALDTGEAPFAASVQGAPFVVSERELFVMEQVQAAINAAIKEDSLISRELDRLYRDARNQLTVDKFHKGDWNTASVLEKQIAQEKHDFLFKLETINGKSDYISRFMAMALGNQEVSNLLGFQVTPRVAPTATNLADKVMNLFRKVLGLFSDKLTKAKPNELVKDRAMSLAKQLTAIEAKNKAMIARKMSARNPVAAVEETFEKVVDKAKSKLEDIADSKFVANNKYQTVQAAGTLAKLFANDGIEGFFKGMQDFRNYAQKTRNGLAASLITEIRGHAQVFSELLRSEKHREGVRKDIIQSAARVALSGFDNNGDNLTNNEKSSITAVFLRSGMHVLLDRLGMLGIQNVLSDASARKAEIDNLNQQLKSVVKNNNFNYMVKQAKALAYYRVSGKVTVDNLMFNSHNIARGFGVFTNNHFDAKIAEQAQPILDELISLYVLDYSTTVDRETARIVLDKEMARSEGNGVENVLKLSKRLQEESEKTLFDGDPSLMMHGYMPEIFDPNMTAEIANAEQGALLLAAGYVEVNSLPKDEHDPDREPLAIYVLKGIGLQQYNSGAVSLTSLKSKGSKLFGNASMQPWEATAHLAKAKMNAVKNQFNNDPGFDPRKVDKVHAAPIVNRSGGITAYRYMMSEHQKDSLLRRNNSFDQVLGTLAGSIFDRPTALEHNNNVMDALQEDYENTTDAKHNFIEISATSPDAEMRELWAMLPDHTRDHIEVTWPNKKMFIRKEAVDIVFGYRKLSLATWLSKDPANRNKMEQAIIGSMESILKQYAKFRLGKDPAEAEAYAKRLAIWAAKGERGWQEIMKEVKDVIVIRSMVVLLGNQISNFYQLVMSGVPVLDIVKNMKTATEAALAYQQENSMLQDLTLKLEAGIFAGQEEEEAKKEIARLTHLQNISPIKKMIDAGLMPTIVEDLASEEDIYSYKSYWKKRLEEKTSKLPKSMVNAADHILINRNTPLHQGLSRVTQLSDFTARYVLYKHLTERKDNRMSHEEAAQRVSEDFINYDIPMQRQLQYLDDMGLVMFMKYFLRIQRVLMRLFRENPLRMLTMATLGSFVDLGPSVLDSGMWGRIGNNPLDVGAFRAPGTIDDIFTINSALSLVK